jgi:hypothetical protein
VKRTTLTALWLFCACSDVQLVPEELTDRLSVGGELCAGPAVSVQRNIKVIFLADSSGAAHVNDPTDLLVKAIQYTTTSYASSTNISFAMARFGGGITYFMNEQQGIDPSGNLFTSDPAVLARIYALMLDKTNVSYYLDGVSYEKGLDDVTSYIIRDQSMSSGELASTSYVVQFVAAGMTFSLTADPSAVRQAILSKVDALHTNYGVRLDVTSIANFVISAPEYVGLLPAMAKAGGGIFTQLGSPDGLEDVFKKAVGASSTLLDYELFTYFAYNRNVRSGANQILVDSDGDGLPDDVEMQGCTSPTNADTDGDGLSDLFESTLAGRGEFNPCVANQIAWAAGDRDDDDGDGLTNFEESRLHTDPSNPDTDRDGMIDLIELVNGTDPLTDDAQADPDGDQIPNLQEVISHLNPHVAETDAMRQNYSYKTIPALAPYEVVYGQKCYKVQVDNIALVHTLRSVDRNEGGFPAGSNEIELVGLARVAPSNNIPADLLPPVRLLRVSRTVVFGPQGQRDPATPSIGLNPSDFAAN